MAQHVFKKGQGYPDRRLMHPRREWSIGLLVFAVVVVGGAFASSQVYVKYSDVDALIIEADTKIVSYDKQTVDAALELFRKRALLYETLNAKTVTIETVQSVSTTTQATSSLQTTASDIVAP